MKGSDSGSFPMLIYSLQLLRPSDELMADMQMLIFNYAHLKLVYCHSAMSLQLRKYF